MGGGDRGDTNLTVKPAVATLPENEGTLKSHFDRLTAVPESTPSDTATPRPRQALSVNISTSSSAATDDCTVTGSDA